MRAILVTTTMFALAAAALVGGVNAAGASGELPLYGGRNEFRMPPVGAALDPVAEGSACPFKNIMRCATPFRIPGVGKSEWNIGSDGYPASFANEDHIAQATMQARLGAGGYPTGDYVLLFDGGGTLSVGGDAGLATSTADASSTGTSLSFSVSQATDTGIVFTINATDSSTPISNVRVGLSSDESDITDSTSTASSSVFNADWLSLASEFDVLFLGHWQREWRNTYDDNPPSWSSRPVLSTAATQGTDAGVSHDAAVLLAEQANTGLWLTVPWNAPSDYVSSLASFYASSSAYTNNATKKLYVSDSAYVLFLSDPAPRIERYKMIAAAFRTAFGDRMSTQVEIVLDCQNRDVCANTLAKLNRLEPSTLDNDFRAAIDAVSTQGAVIAGNSPWQEANPNPYYHKLAPYVNDVHRIAQEELWSQDVRNFEFASWLALQGYPLYGLTADVRLHVPAFGHRFRVPNNTLAEIEATLERNFWNYEKSNGEGLGNLTAEAAERWVRGGGRLFIAGKLVSRGIECDDATTHLSGMNRLQCGYQGLTRSLSGASSASRLQGLRRWRNRDNAFIDSLMRNEPQQGPAQCAPACVWGACVEPAGGGAPRCECHSGYTGDDCSTFDERKLANRCSPTDYGVNLGGLPDWSPIWAWNDMTKYSRRWVHQPAVQPATGALGWIWAYTSAHNRTQLELREDGFPTRLAPNDVVGTFQRRDTYQYPHGEYHLFYDGDGIVEAGFDGHIDRRVRPGHMILEVKPVRQMNNGLWFKILRTNPDDPIRNVRIVHASQLGRFKTQAFHPLFVRSMQDYRHIRFMNNMLTVEKNYTNASLQHNWQDRPTPSYYSQAAKGMAVEHIIELSNQVHAKPWVNVPFHATDDYVNGLAQMIKRDLNPRLFPVTVEYSNEVWATHHNIGFYAQDNAIAAGLDDGSNVVRARACWNQRRAREIWRIFAQHNVSVRRVLAGQSVWTQPILDALSCEENVAAEVDVLGIAPYVGESLEGPDALRGVDEVFNTAELAINASVRGVEAHAEVAQANGLGVVTYEAGPSYFGGAQAEDPDVEARGIAIHASPRMEELVARYFAAIRAAGASVINAYFVGPAGSWSKYGAWGMRPYQNEAPSQSHKVRGYTRYAAEHATCDATASIDAAVRAPTGCPSDCSGHGWCLSNGQCACHWGYNGTDCSNSFWIPDTQHCNRYTCADKNGTCQPVGVDGVFRLYQCRGCDSGWGGWHCHVPRCDTLNNCSWNGDCTGPRQCTCYRGYRGADCSESCGCGGRHGTCGSDGQCVCDAGYRLGENGCEPTCDCATCLAPGVCGCSERCVYGHCWNGTCNCWSGYTGSRCERRDENFRAPNHASTMGINVAGISDWALSIPFVNFMWRSRDWIVRQAGELQPNNRWSVRETVPLTEAGYPAMLPPDRVASTFATRDVGTSEIRGGRFHVYWDGEGLIEFGFDAREVEGSRAKGFALVDYTPRSIRDNGFFITIRRTNPQNPVRNIRVLPPWQPDPGYFTAMPFSQPFLDDLRPYRTIRFYGWQGLHQSYNNGSAYHSREWRDRKRLFAASMAFGNGVNEDLMIHLSNLLGAEPWFTIPHDASDDYVRKFATLIKRRLRPDVMVHVEHSNEVWNPAFESYKYALHHGRRAFPGESDFRAAIRWHGRRSQQIFQIFRTVFGAAQRDRLKFHLGTWAISARATDIAANEITIRPVTVSTTTYFCGESTFGGEAASQVLSVNELVSACSAAVGSANASIAAHMSVIAEHGLEPTMSAYEGGPSLVQYSAMMGGYPRPGVAERFADFHRSEALGAVVKAYLDSYRANGISHVNYFTSAAKYTRYGSWGIKESTRQTCSSSAKCQAVTEWISANQNDTARRPTWGMFEYGTNNVVTVTFDRVPTKPELDASARSLELRLTLPVFSISAVIDDSPTTGGTTAAPATPSASAAASRRQSSSSSTVLYIVSESSGSAAAADTAAQLQQTLSSTTDASTIGISGASITSTQVAETTDVILPTSELPQDVQDAPPAGGYSAPSAVIGAVVSPTPAPPGATPAGPGAVPPGSTPTPSGATTTPPPSTLDPRDARNFFNSGAPPAASIAIAMCLCAAAALLL